MLCSKLDSVLSDLQETTSHFEAIPLADNINLLPIDLQSRIINDIDGSLEISMSRIIPQHVSL